MGIFDRFPYSSTHEMNLDYMLGKATEIAEDMQTLTAGMEQVQAGLSAISEKTEQATQAAAQAAQSASSIEGSVASAEEAAEEAQMHNESAQTWANNALTYKADCQRAATEAAASATSAAQAATAAAASEDTVAQYAQAANASAQSAANNNDSAHQYANQANASASNATFHSSNAQTAATNAQTAATNANTSATNAAASADRAAAQAVAAANSAAQASATKTNVENLVESLPKDFTDLNNTVNQLSDDIGDLKSALDNCLMFEHFVEVEHTDTPQYLFNNSTMTASSFSGFSYTIVAAAEGETYNVSGYGSSVYSPVFASDSEALLTFDLEENATAPSGTTRLIVNGRPSTGMDIEIRKIATTEESKEFFKRIDSLEEGVLSNKTIGVSLSSSGVCRIFQKNYDDGYDFETEITKKSGNDLPDIYGFYRVTNSSDIVLNESNGTEVAIVSSSTDFLSPSTVYAVNNMDGDFPDLTSGKLTGGWHRYNSSTITGTATARNISYKVFCDGVEVVAGSPTRGNEVVVDIVNRLQASNTEKSDGTGREVVEQHFRLVFGKGFGCKVYGEITALEDILYATYYGVSTFNIANVPVRFIGCRTNRQGNTPSADVRCGDKYCIGTMQVSQTDTYEIGFDPTIDLGTQFANKWINSCIMSSNKAYMVLIFATSQNDMLALSANDKVYWKGYYNCYPTVN